MTRLALDAAPPRTDVMDFYDLSARHSPDEARFETLTRAFVTAHILPHIQAWWEDGVFPKALPRQLGEQGLLGVTLPAEYGGGGSTPLAYGLICKALEFGDSGVRSFVSVQSSLVMYPVFRYCSEALKKSWLPRLASGEAVGCFSLTEPDAGSDPASLTTTAKRVGDEWILSGEKRWATNALLADLAIVWAKDAETGKVLGFAIETGAEGFERFEIPHKASMRASSSAGLKLHEIRVPETQRLNVEGLRGPLSCLNQARFGIAFGALGAGYACFDEVRAYTEKRTVFGKPLATKQLVQEKLADMLAELTKGSLLAYQLAQLKTAGQDTPARVSLAKRDNVRAALSVARAARDLLGANGITTDYASIRHMLNLETVSTYEGTDTVHTLVLGREITGHNAF